MKKYEVIIHFWGYYEVFEDNEEMKKYEVFIHFWG